LPKTPPICVVTNDYDQPVEIEIDSEVKKYLFSGQSDMAWDKATLNKKNNELGASELKLLDSFKENKRIRDNLVLGRARVERDTFSENLESQLETLSYESTIWERGTKTFLFPAVITGENPSLRLNNEFEFDTLVWSSKFDANK